MPAKRQCWLIKSEPSVYPWSRLVDEGRAAWDGVRNYEARNNLRAMRVGDYCLFYHSGEGREVVGVARVCKAAYADPTSDEDWSAVDLEPVTALAKPVGLAAMKKHKTLSGMAVVKKPRISVTPVTPDELAAVLEAGETTLR